MAQLISRNNVEWLRNLARNYADGIAGIIPQEHPAWDIAAEIEEAAAFLDGMADSLQPWWEPGADDCRAMAARLRGET